MTHAEAVDGHVVALHEQVARTDLPERVADRELRGVDGGFDAEGLVGRAPEARGGTEVAVVGLGGTLSAPGQTALEVAAGRAEGEGHAEVLARPLFLRFQQGAVVCRAARKEE